jgi:HPt (histidine-containing phosphotransfer) domain-containing protein
MIPWVDRGRLAEQTDLLGHAFLRDVAARFEQVAAQTMAGIEAAFAGPNAAADEGLVRALCHRLRSAAGALGLCRLDQAAARAAGCRPGELRTVVTEIGVDLHRSIEELRAALADPG